ncbi:MAG: hypothetical protein AAF352_04690 [Pseudomonadota bacterium]
MTASQNAIILEEDIGNFHLKFFFNKRTQLNEFHVISQNKAKHRAVYTKYHMTDGEGEIIGNPVIDYDAAKIIIARAKTHGITECFNVPGNTPGPTKKSKDATRKPLPENVRHKVTDSEKSYTSTGAKLQSHWPIFQKLAETNHASIIRATMTLHQVCASHCPFCSTIARNRKDAITLQEAKEFVTTLYDDQAAHNRQYFKKYNDRYRAARGSDIR